MTAFNKISNNVISIIIGKSIDLLFSIVIISLIARNLGVEKYGVFTSIVALTFIVSKVTDFGFAPIVFRESSKSNSVHKLLNTALTLRIILFVGLASFFNIVAPLTNLQGKEVLYSNILFLNIILSAKYMNFRELLEIEFKVNYNMIYVMVLNIIDSIFLLAVVVVMPLLNGSLEYLIWGYVLANLPGFLGLLFFLRKKYKYTYHFKLNESRWLIKQAFPLFGTVLLTALFQQADVLFLRNMDSTRAVGIYGAATRLASPLGIIPLALITTVFPIIVKNLENQGYRNRSTNNLVFKTLFLFAFCISTIITFHAKDFASLFFGKEYVDAYLPMIILFWSFIFIFFNTFSLNLLTAHDLQKFNFFCTLTLVVSNFALIILLISDLSFNGVALAKLGAAILETTIFIFVLRKYKVHYNFLSMWTGLWIMLILFAVYLLSYLPLPVYLVLSFLSVVIITLKIRFYTIEEISLLLNLLGNNRWKEKILKII